MIIAGVVLHVDPSQAVRLAASLQHREGITRVAGPVAPGRMVAVLEAADEEAMQHLIDGMFTAKGIISVNPAYIHFDTQQEEIHT